jgi:hypothetical protein
VGGWESLPATGGNQAHVAATTPTLPIAHNARHAKGCGIHPADRITIHRGVGILPAVPFCDSAAQAALPFGNRLLPKMLSQDGDLL